MSEKPKQSRKRSFPVKPEALPLLEKTMRGKGFTYSTQEQMYEELAEKSNLSTDTIKNFFNPQFQRPPQKNTIQSIAKTLGLMPENLVEGWTTRTVSNAYSLNTSAVTLDTSIFQRMLDKKIRELTANIFLSGNLETAKLYVPLGLIERKEKSKHKKITPENGSALYRANEYEISREFENDQFLTEVLLQGNSPKSLGRRIAIIGEPGSGKTTRLQQIAQWLIEQSTENKVIWVSLADLRGRSLEDYLLNVWLKDTLNKREASEADQDELVEIFNQSNVWLLLDGIDEMGLSGNPLAWVNDQIRGWIDQAKIIATCRINVWDGNRQALNQFDVYRNLDFSDAQRDQFITNFLDNPELSNGLIDELGKPGKERISDLVRNPLRLTLICRSWQKRQGALPYTKAGLYQECVEAYYDWKEKPETTKAQRKELHRALGELAKQALDRDNFRFRLTEAQVSKVLGESDESLFKLALDLGWLNKIGEAEENHQKIYAFLHPSFQEYFAALAIDKWTFFLNHNNDDPNPFKKHNKEDCAYRVFAPEWKDVVCNWIGLDNINDNQKDELIENLYEFKDGLDDTNLFKKYALVLSLCLVSQYKKYKKINFLIDDGLALLGDTLFAKDIQEPLFFLETDYLRQEVLKKIKSNDSTSFLSLNIFVNDNTYKLIGRLFKGNCKLKLSLIDELKIILKKSDDFTFEKLGKDDIARLILELDKNDSVANIFYKKNKHNSDYQEHLEYVIDNEHEHEQDVVFEDLLLYVDILEIGGYDSIARQTLKLIRDAFENKKYEKLINIAIKVDLVKDRESLYYYLTILYALLALSSLSFRFKSYNIIEYSFLSLIARTCKEYTFSYNKEEKYHLFSSQFCIISNIINQNGCHAFNDLKNLIHKLKLIYHWCKNIISEGSTSEENFSVLYDQWNIVECLEKLSKEISYPEFYKAWHGDSFQQNNSDCKKSNQIIINQPYFLSINTENLNIEINPVNLLKRFRKRLFNSLPKEIKPQISEFIKNQPKLSPITLDTLYEEVEDVIIEIKNQLQVNSLVLFLNNSQPSQLLLNTCKNFSDLVQIEWNR